MNISHFFRFFLLVFFIFLAVPSAKALTPPQYDIQAKVDVLAKTIAATQSVTWTNDSDTDVTELLFHIYPNRRYTKEEENLLWRYAGYFKVNPFPDGFQTGEMSIASAIQDQQPLSFTIEGDDQTLLSVKLAGPLKPGSSVKVDLIFSVKIPRITLGRFGWNDNVFRLSRWYPILCVFENGKGWKRNPFYPFHRPFFSEAANYKVSLTVPAGQQLISSGTQTGQTRQDSGTITTTFESFLPIREFTFAMSPDYQSVSSEIDGVWIKSYYLPGNKRVGELALENAKNLFRFYAPRFGKYPYSNFSIAPVDLGYGGEQMSNMIFIDRRAYELPRMMDRYFDFLVSHEAGHQWFYNMVGINEYEEMWLEEGVNSYFIQQYLAEKYGEDGSVIEFPVWAKPARMFLPELTFKNTRDTLYRSLARVGKDHPVVSDLSSFREPSAIFSVAYGKGARVLEMLRHHVGEGAFSRIFQRIFAEYRFKNLSVKDFIRIAQEESPTELTRFFDQWLYGDEHLNYSVAGVGPGRVTLQNRGGIVMPAQVEVHYRDGSKENFVWEGAQRLETIELKKTAAVKNVSIDPRSELLDLDPVNNHWPRRLYAKAVPLYTPLQEISTMLPDDGYSLIVGPELANNGLGVKASIQKPYDQIFYAASDYEFGEQLHHSRAGYQLRNILKSQTSLGFEVANVTDHDNGEDDLVSGKVYLRRELSSARYNVGAINDHVSLYVLRNQSVNQGVDLQQKEGIRNTNYRRNDEAIIGTSFHYERAGPAPDPRKGYKVDLFAENAGHFLDATEAFTRAAVDTSGYFPVTAQSKAALRIKYGGGYPNDKELFYAGGIDGLRGYERKSIRGANMLLGSLEYRFPIVDGLKISVLDNIFRLESISGVVFGDAGQAWNASASDSTLSKDAGAGLRFTITIGSLFEKVMVRADVAQAIEDDEEDDPRFWLGINHAF